MPGDPGIPIEAVQLCQRKPNKFGGRADLRPAPCWLRRRFAPGPLGIDQAKEHSSRFLRADVRDGG